MFSAYAQSSAQCQHLGGTHSTQHCAPPPTATHLNSQSLRLLVWKMRAIMLPSLRSLNEMLMYAKLFENSKAHSSHVMNHYAPTWSIRGSKCQKGSVVTPSLALPDARCCQDFSTKCRLQTNGGSNRPLSAVGCISSLSSHGYN